MFIHAETQSEFVVCKIVLLVNSGVDRSLGAPGPCFFVVVGGGGGDNLSFVNLVRIKYDFMGGSPGICVCVGWGGGHVSPGPCSYNPAC